MNKQNSMAKIFISSRRCDSLIGSQSGIIFSYRQDQFFQEQQADDLASLHFHAD